MPSEVKLLRFAAPALYEELLTAFSTCHIHPYDVQATVVKDETGFDVSLKFSADFSQSLSRHFPFAQAERPDEETAVFFREAAEQCKSLLISNYYKMMKI